MAMPSGDSPQKVQQLYLYLQGHQVPRERSGSWHVDWISVAWMWGFVVVLAALLALWVKQYRTTRQRTGISPLDNFGGITEGAGPATAFFLFLTLVVVAYVVVIIVGHLVSGQKY